MWNVVERRHVLADYGTVGWLFRRAALACGSPWWPPSLISSALAYLSSSLNRHLRLGKTMRAGHSLKSRFSSNHPASKHRSARIHESRPKSSKDHVVLLANS